MAKASDSPATGPGGGVPSSLPRGAARAAVIAALPRTAWLEIDLAVVAANLDIVRGLAGAGAGVHPVVKADAYGHGAVPIARGLRTAGADGLCVATIDEAISLRRAGIGGPLLVLYPIPGAWAVEAARNHIAVTAGDPALLAELLAALAVPRASSGRPIARLGVHLEVETGLGRGGFQGAALVGAAEAIVTHAGTRLAGLWTHLQAPEDAGITARQVDLFEAAASLLRAAGITVPRRHLRASGSLLGDAMTSYDVVRPGLSIYGLVPDELSGAPIASEGAGLQPALSLHARPVRVADVEAGWGISYGPTFRTPGPARIATLPVGYGDGWSRALSNRAEAIVRGGRVPLVGNVAMDAVMADVSAVPGAPVTVADEFVLIGRQGGQAITVADVARARGTNSWEVVTGFARRLPRVYHAASGPTVTRTLISRGSG